MSIYLHRVLQPTTPANGIWLCIRRLSKRLLKYTELFWNINVVNPLRVSSLCRHCDRTMILTYRQGSLAGFFRTKQWNSLHRPSTSLTSIKLTVCFSYWRPNWPKYLRDKQEVKITTQPISGFLRLISIFGNLQNLISYINSSSGEDACSTELLLMSMSHWWEQVADNISVTVLIVD